MDPRSTRSDPPYRSQSSLNGTASIYLVGNPGGIRLSNNGDTLMRISYDHDIEAQ